MEHFDDTRSLDQVTHVTHIAWSVMFDDERNTVHCMPAASCDPIAFILTGKEPI